MDLRAWKREIRRATLQNIRALDPARRAAEDRALSEAFASLPGFEAAGCVLLYASAFAEETPTTPLLHQALARGKRLVCPRVNRVARRLDLFHIESPGRDLVAGAMGIPEPRPGCPPVEPGQVDWVLVPGIAFDPRGFRLGRGGGYYDLLLPTLRADAPRWALIYDVQWVDELPVEAHDAPVDGIMSLSKTVRRAAR